MAKEVWAEENVSDEDGKAKYQKQLLFPIGQPNDAFAQYFSGQSYLAPLSDLQIGIFNVTFEPGCRNNWHTHHATSGWTRYQMTITVNWADIVQPQRCI